MLQEARGPHGVSPRSPTPATPAEARAYHRCVVALEQFVTCPTVSGRSNTDWTATRPGPCRVSQMVLACHRAELNQYWPRGYSKCSHIWTVGSFQIRLLGCTQMRSPGARSRMNVLPGPCSSSRPGPP